MKLFFLKKRLASAFIFGFAVIFSALNISQAYSPLADTVYDELHQFEQIVDFNFGRIDEKINETIVGRDIFIEIFGYLQLIMGKNEQAGFETIKDNEGFLHSAYFITEKDALALAEYTAREISEIKDGIENTRLLYVQRPKRLTSRGQLLKGMPYLYENESADYLLKLLKKDGIDVVDLRESLQSSGKTRDEAFYKTAPYWKTETGFWAFSELITEMNALYTGLDLDSGMKYRDINSYNTATYKNSYLGEFGRKTGKYYAGEMTDDFTVIYPKFKTSLTLTKYNGVIEQKIYEGSGLFEDLLISAAILRSNGSIYSDDYDKFFSYHAFDSGFCRIENLRAQNAPKIVFICGAEMAPSACFASTVFSSVYMVNPALFENTGELISRVNALGADYCVVSY